jgi:hypothetical protein
LDFDMGCRLIFLFLSILVGGARAQPILLDDGGDAARWAVSGSDGVEASASVVPREEGAALRVQFDFRRGSGYFVARREVNLDLPEKWRFAFEVRGPGPRNNLEFKLIDETGENVWWVNQRGYEFGAGWSRVDLKKRKFTFAWGPGGPSTPLTRVKAIEIAVAAGTGGKGALEFDSFVFEALPAAGPPGPVRVSASSCTERNPPPAVLPENGVINWRSAADDAEPFLELDLGGVREIGGVSLDWSPLHAPDYDLERADEQGRWSTVFSVRGGFGGQDHLPLLDAEAAKIRLTVRRAAAGGVLLKSVRVREPGFSESNNAFIRAVAADAPRGRYPRAFLGEQSYWTVVGAPEDEEEALVSEDGALELGKGGPTIEPFLLVEDEVKTWADATITHALAASGVPHPIVRWQVGDVTLEARFADGPAGSGTVHAAYTLRNRGARRAFTFLALAARPLQAMPLTQDLNMTGGVSRIESIERRGAAMRVGGRVLRFTEQPWSMGGFPFATCEIAEALVLGLGPEEEVERDPMGLASAAALFECPLEQGEERRIGLIAQLKPMKTQEWMDANASPVPLGELDDAVRESERRWVEALTTPRFALPASAQRYADTFHAQIAYILINRDGPAIQPGSRAYDRTWIRDGALTSTALLYAGHAREVRAFIDWFAPFQYENGKIPCCADERGPDPVPEHDSHGQYLYAVAEYDRFMRDDAFLRGHLPRVKKAVEYIESLRATRMTDEYGNVEGLERAKFGLMPESISHEGYSAKPMHSYWDDFWTLRGLEDAAYIAGRVGEPSFEAQAAAAAESIRACLYDSMRRTMALKGIDFIPGCVELGDFDATSTSIGVFPIGEHGRIPEPQLTNTFDRYAKWFDARAGGLMNWRDYTPYEIRNATTFLFLDRRDVTHRMMDFFFRDQRPPPDGGWNAWAEVVRNGERTPGFIGDLPHTWVGSDFVKLLRTMFVHERGDGALVLGMGITREWMRAEGGASADDLPTHYGTIGLSFFEREGARVVQVRGDLRPPPAGIEIALESLAGSEIELDGVRAGLSPAGRLVLPWPVREVMIRDRPK